MDMTISRFGHTLEHDNELIILPSCFSIWANLGQILTNNCFKKSAMGIKTQWPWIQLMGDKELQKEYGNFCGVTLFLYVEAGKTIET